jgi:DNA-binding winged helix-turn-helix (wHTH) protein
VTNGALPEKAFQTLVHLVRHGGTLLTKEELLLAVWSDTIVEENNLGKAIHAIRRCLGERTGEQKYIETVPKHGYRFVAEVRRISDDPIIR